MARQSSRSAAGAEADGARAVRHWPGRKPNGEVGVGRRFIAAPGAGRAGLGLPGPAGPLFCLVLLFKQSPFVFLGLLILKNSASCPERLWSLPLWKHPTAIWMQFCSVCSGMTLKGGWPGRPMVVPCNQTYFVIPKSCLVLLAGNTEHDIKLTC